MITIRQKGYDSGTTTTACDWCSSVIGPDESKMLCGTGNTFLLTYHQKCFHLMVKDREGTTGSELRVVNTK